MLSTEMGRVASFYYLHYTTMGLLAEHFRGRDLGVREVLEVGHCSTNNKASKLVAAVLRSFRPCRNVHPSVT